MKINEIDDKQLRQAYVVAYKSYNDAYRTKKEIEEEMFKRFDIELENNRK